MSIPALLSSLFLTLGLTGQAAAQVTSDRANIPVIGQKCNERVRDVASVSAQLRVPSGFQMPGPLVVILHSNAGIVGVGSFYGEALNAAGIATLEVDSFTPRGVRDGSDRVAPVFCDRLQEVWGALAFAAQDVRFDPRRIGVAGFSSGGALAVLAGMGVRPLRLPRDDPRLPQGLTYAAHFAVYPGCANLMDDPVRIRSWINPGRPQNWGATQRRIHIVSGTADDFDIDPRQDCLRMSREFPEIAPYLSVRLVEGATHAFDWRNPPSPSFNPFAKAQAGGIVTMRYSQADALRTRAEMVEFFKTELADR
jgi:dienelactone hydrolase